MSDDDPTERQRVAAIAAFAEREGFTVSLVFVETRWQRTLALNAMTAYCQRHDVRNVIVPTIEHLNTLPGIAELSKELLEQDIGGHVWIVAPTEEEPSCQSSAAKDGEPR
ncbi:hypothetical protein [Streptomyces sp. NPDC056628]|uniref:hypothetical protein n=1 Tax=Streptomyces sp. NPDC056628 TaxID=3345882 RepID=UPI0036C2D026